MQGPGIAGLLFFRGDAPRNIGGNRIKQQPIFLSLRGFRNLKGLGNIRLVAGIKCSFYLFQSSESWKRDYAKFGQTTTSKFLTNARFCRRGFVN